MSHISLRRKIFLRHHYHPLTSLLQPKLTHSHTFPSPKLDLSNPTFMICGSNTGVGKTLVSAGIAASVLSSPNPSHCLYIKPVQTGFPADSDSRFLYLKIPHLLRRTNNHFPLFASNRVLNASSAVLRAVAALPDEALGDGEGTGCRKLGCLTLYGWREAVSAHLAAEREGMAVDDGLLREELGGWLGGRDGGEEEGLVWRLVETAGGVASPGPSGSLQCDLYRQVVSCCYVLKDWFLHDLYMSYVVYSSHILHD